MSEWCKIVEKIKNEHESKNCLKEYTYEQLENIFNLKELKEVKEENRTSLWLANHTYNDFIKACKEKNYRNIEQQNCLEIILEDVTIYLFLNSNYNHAGYDSENNYIIASTILSEENVSDSIEKDFALRSILIHELTHRFSMLNTDDYFHPDLNNPEKEYYLQDTEIESNTDSICDFIINLIKNEVRDSINQFDIQSEQKIQNKINQVLNVSLHNEGFLYHNFLVNLVKDKEKFQMFYKDVVDTCIDYIKNNLVECYMTAIANTMNESKKTV